MSRGESQRESGGPDAGLDSTSLGSRPKVKSRVRHSTDWATQAPPKQYFLKSKLVLLQEIGYFLRKGLEVKSKEQKNGMASF